MRHLKKCLVCRSDFVTRKRTKKTCSPKCERKRLAQEVERRKELQQQIEISKEKDSLEDKAWKAKERNLSYGQLQAEKYKEEHGI